MTFLQSQYSATLVWETNHNLNQWLFTLFWNSRVHRKYFAICTFKLVSGTTPFLKLDLYIEVYIKYPWFEKNYVFWLNWPQMLRMLIILIIILLIVVLYLCRWLYGFWLFLGPYQFTLITRTILWNLNWGIVFFQR